MLAITFYDTVKWLHVTAVVVGLGGAFTYPLWFHYLADAPTDQRAFFHRTQASLGRYLISPGLLVIILTGAYMASDRDLWSKAWVTVPLVIALILGGLAGAYFAPRERRLAELAGGAQYQALFAQVRAVTWVVLALIAVAAFFMVTKLGS
jgi:uncharacterized membrane protein